MASYTCHCPLGRNGTTCSQVIGYDPMPRSCQSGRHLRVHDETWQQDCNRCRCDDGHIVCSKIWCGPSSCLAVADETFSMYEPDDQSVFSCSQGFFCRPIQEHECFTPPCHPWGVCEKTASEASSDGYRQEHGYLTGRVDNLKDGRDLSLSVDHTGMIGCESGGNNDLSGTCIRLLLTFDLWIMPVGMTVEAVCNDIRQLPHIHDAAQDAAIFIICRKAPQETDTIDLTVSTDGNANAITANNVSQALISGLQGRSGNSPVVLNAITSIQQMSPSLVVSARFNARFLILAYMVVLVAISLFGCTVIAFGRRRHGCLNSQPPPPPPSLPLHVLTGSDQGIAESATTITTITTTMHQALNDYIIDENKTSDKSSTSRTSSSFRDDVHHYENDARRNQPTSTGYLVPDFERLNHSNKGSNRRVARRPRSRSEKEPT
eukprot:XP_011675859.1 PREDICTED: protein jagged-2-like [Strongylocentrotus purpuratus]